MFLILISYLPLHISILVIIQNPLFITSDGTKTDQFHAAGLWFVFHWIQMKPIYWTCFSCQSLKWFELVPIDTLEFAVSYLTDFWIIFYNNLQIFIINKLSQIFSFISELKSLLTNFWNQNFISISFYFYF